MKKFLPLLSALGLTAIFVASYINSDDADAYGIDVTFELITGTKASSTETPPAETSIADAKEYVTITALGNAIAVSSTEPPVVTQPTTITTAVQTTVTEATTITTHVTSQQTVVITRPQKIGSNPVEECAAESPYYYNTCAFIGDSHINAFQGYGIVAPSRVFAKDGMNITQVNDFIDLNKVSAVNPENIYVMIGTNGVSWLKHSLIIDKYTAFIKQIREKMPNAHIYIMSIPPVGANIEAKPSTSEGRILNSEIDAYNNALLSMASSLQISYIDLNSSLKGSDGMLPADYSKTDGMHVVKSIYESVISPYILTHIVK